jgi:hypothetical protein
VIHLPIERSDLLNRISALKPTWLERAQREADKNRAAGRHVSTQRIWSEVKPIFVHHQREKCAFCERELGSGAISWDVEHYRPKGRVDVWASPSSAVDHCGDADDRGYFCLAFEPGNYLVACKPCNSRHKRNFFPVAAARMLRTADVDSLIAEQPYLLNPLDPAETPPESIIGFHGISPQAISDDETNQLRAKVTIEVLGLFRPDLARPRARLIMAMWLALEQAARGSEFARDFIDAYTRPGSEFANCARCFADLYNRSRNKAEEVAEEASRYVLSRTR